MTITKELLDELLSGVENADDFLGEHGLMKELKVRLMERMLGAKSSTPRMLSRASTASSVKPLKRVAAFQPMRLQRN